MKKVSKKIKVLSAFLVAILLGVAVKVNAITTNDTIKGKVDTNSSYVTDKETLTVTGVQTGDSFKAYKLLDTFYNSTANTVSYEFTTAFKAYLDSTTTHTDFTVDDYFELTKGDITSGSTQTTSTLDKLVSGYISYVKTNSVAGTDMTNNGNTVTAQLEAGAYLVLPVSTTRVYATMVGNLDFEANGATWTLNSESIVAKVSDAGVTKTVSGTEGKNLFEEEFTYTVVGTVPSYPTNATNRVYTIKDTMSAGLSFIGLESGKFAVKDGETELTVAADGKVTDATGNVVATVTIEGQVMTAVFDVRYVTAPTVTLTYNAKLNENAVLGDAGNKNKAQLTYSNDPYGNGTYTTPADDEDPEPGSGPVVDTKVYGIEVLKYAGTDETAVLGGAEFEVYSDADLTTKVGTITTAENGIGTLKGIVEGTYYLKEVKAPAGYRLEANAIEVKVNVEGSVAASTEGYFVAKISNTKNGLLPFTGGNGIIIYSIFGILIIGLAAYLTVENQKKKKMNVQD